MSKPSQWSCFLHLVELWYNSSHHSAIGMSPFEATFPPPPLFNDADFSPTLKAATDYHETHKNIIDMLKLNLERDKQQMKTNADKDQTDVQFEVGDRVFFKLHKYRQNSLTQRLYFKPFQIISHISSVAYKLNLPPRSRIHDMFHISLLKRAHNNTQLLTMFPIDLTGFEDEPVHDKGSDDATACQPSKCPRKTPTKYDDFV